MFIFINAFSDVRFTVRVFGQIITILMLEDLGIKIVLIREDISFDF